MTEPLQDPRNVPRLLGLAVGCAVYFAVLMLHPPVLSYLPELEQWSFSPPEGAIAMRYYGMPQWGVMGFLVGWALGRVGPVATALQSRTGARLLAVAAGIAVASCMGYTAVEELGEWGSR